MRNTLKVYEIVVYQDGVHLFATSSRMDAIQDVAAKERKAKALARTIAGKFTESAGYKVKLATIVYNPLKHDYEKPVFIDFGD